MASIVLTFLTPGTTPVNLTTGTDGSGEGTQWAENLSATGVNDQQKSGGTGTIGPITAYGIGAVLSNYTADFRTISWTDGTPTASSSTDNGVFNSIGGPGQGLKRDFDANTNSNTCYVELGNFNANCKVTAHLNDSSFADQVDTTSVVSSSGSGRACIAKIVYTAASTTTLTVSIEPLAGGDLYATMQSAELYFNSAAPASTAWNKRTQLLPGQKPGANPPLRAFKQGIPFGADVSAAITGQTATFSQGTFTPSTAVAITGQTATFTQGTLTPATAVSITASTAKFSQGAFAPSIAIGITANSASFTSGTFAPS